MSEEHDEHHEDVELHPVAELATTLMTGGENGEPYAMSETAKARLTRALDTLHGSIELQLAVSDLIKLGCWLDTEANSPAAANAILEVLKGEIAPLEKVLAEHDPESLADTKRSFDRFRGEDAGPKAPQPDQAPPKGTVKLGTLDYPKRG
jgi:hypothetical protein